MSRIVSIAAAVLMTGAAASAFASSADDAGSSLVVPLAVKQGVFVTSLYVENHEPHPVRVVLMHVPVRGSMAPLPAKPPRYCRRAAGTSLILAAQSVSLVDVDLECDLQGRSFFGALLLVSRDTAGLGRISARAVIDVDNRQALMVDGIPLAYLDTTENIHVVGGLGWDPGVTNATVTTDCFVGTLYDGSGAGGAIGRLTLRDATGQPLGRDRYFQMRPLDFLHLEDVLTAAGVPQGLYTGVTAEIGLTGGGDAVFAYCRTDRQDGFGNTSGRMNTFALHTAQVANPQEETRRRDFSAMSSPGKTFELIPTAPGTPNTPNLHGLYVRHPDVVRCGVASGEDLVLTAVSPDRSQSFSVGNDTGLFAAMAQSHVDQNDLWGLEVSFGPAATMSGPVAYSIRCTSGNGTSLADILP
jgi:hypothetical protein